MTGFDAAWLAAQRAAGRVVSEVGGGAAQDAPGRARTPSPSPGPAQRSEEQEQRAVIAWRDASDRPEVGLLLHPPNGGYRTPREAGVFRALGQLPGVPDLLLLWPSGPWCGLAVEMKGADASGRLGDLSPEQESVMLLLARAGWAVTSCWTARQGIGAVEEYLDDPHAFVGGL